jgi:hypothetical protein
MRRIPILPLLGGLMTLTSTSCSFDYRPESAFTGDYELANGCLLDVQLDSATASCSSEGIEVDASLDGDKLVFTKIAITETVTQTECWLERTCTETYSGSGTRSKDASSLYDGRLSVLSGEWAGKLTRQTKCSVEKPASGAPKYCSSSTDDVVYTFSAKIDFHNAEITWEADSGAKGSFKGEETKGGIRVAETFYKRVEEPGS